MTDFYNLLMLECINNIKMVLTKGIWFSEHVIAWRGLVYIEVRVGL